MHTKIKNKVEFMFENSDQIGLIKKTVHHMYTKPIDNTRTTGKFYIQQIIFF